MMNETDDDVEFILPKDSYKPRTKEMIKQNQPHEGLFKMFSLDSSSDEDEGFVQNHHDRASEKDIFLSEDFIRDYMNQSFRKAGSSQRFGIALRRFLGIYTTSNNVSGEVLYKRVTAEAFLHTSAIKAIAHTRQQAKAQRWLHQQGEQTLGWQKNEVYIKRSAVFQRLRDGGIVVIKHPRKGAPRRITLRMSRKSDRFLVWRGKMRQKRRFDLHSIENIYRGQATVNFERTGVRRNEDRYLSMQNSERILDLEMESEKERDNFIEVVEFVMTWEAKTSPGNGPKRIDRWKNLGYQNQSPPHLD